MKKTIATLMSIIVTILFTACGGGSPDKQTGEETTQTETKTATETTDYASQKTGDELSAGDWQKAIKANYDLDLTVPAGWVFEKGSKANINPSYDLRFTTTAEDFDAAYVELIQHIFDLTEKASYEGNFDVEMDADDEGRPTYGKGNQFDKVPTMMGIPFPVWHFKTPKGTTQISLSDAKSNKLAQIYFVFITSKL